MGKKILTFLTLLITWVQLNSQPKSLDYYLPVTPYDTSIPSPVEVLGYQIGDWHISHDQIRILVDAIDKASDRVVVEEIGRTYEARPLQNLYISTPENLAKLDHYRQAYDRLSDPTTSEGVDISGLPAIVYQGYSIHGNESSGANAAMLMLYHLAAGQSKEVNETLQNTIIIMDPCMNPDGFNRFASWVNSHKNQQANGDSYQRELNEPWPRGRTNHYWFDLNRDWLLLTHPESKARVRQFHKYKPLILTDHHEMGTNSTFFYQPGVPSRTNPNTPQRNQDLTGDIGHYHANALDSIGSLYFTKAKFDDYYYGKGSTYPDANGTIGILFEQASSRGHLQDSKHGPLTFPFTIRNQVVTSLSTLRAAVEMRETLLEYRRWFYQKAIKEARDSSIKGYVFEANTPYITEAFIDILHQHDIQVYSLEANVKINDVEYKKEEAYFVPLEQRQYTLVKTIFETVHEFPDSIFYDVSAWTLPLAFDIKYAQVHKGRSKIQSSLQASKKALSSVQYAPNSKQTYAYAIDWEAYHAPYVVHELLEAGVVVHVSNEPFQVDDTTLLSRGCMIVAVQNQVIAYSQLDTLMRSYADSKGVPIYALTSGRSIDDTTLGSPRFQVLQAKKILLLAGKGSGYMDVGEMWHQLDVRYEIPVSVVDIQEINPKMLDNYTTIILANATPSLSPAIINKIKDWLTEGGTLIATKKSIAWLISSQLIQLDPVAVQEYQEGNSKYQVADSRHASRLLGGAIMEAQMDLTHPITYGYQDDKIHLFKRGTSLYQATKNPYATPIRYTDQPVASGYVPRGMDIEIARSAAVSLHEVGSGSIVAFQDSPVFRGYWYGGHRLLANAIYLADIINRKTKD